MYQCNVVLINESKGYRFDNFSYQSDCDTIGELFKNLKKIYGGHASKMYIDADKGAKQIGWVFSKRSEYDDWRASSKFPKYFLQSAWVSVNKIEEAF